MPSPYIISKKSNLKILLLFSEKMSFFYWMMKIKKNMSFSLLLEKHDKLPKGQNYDVLCGNFFHFCRPLLIFLIKSLSKKFLKLFLYVILDSIKISCLQKQNLFIKHDQI